MLIFSKKWQKILKVLHVLSASILFGSILTLFFLTVLKSHFSPVENLFYFDYSIYHIFNTVIIYSFYVVLLTAFLFATFTQWGYIKHYWIILKWIISILLFALVWIGWGLSINGMVAISDANFKILTAIPKYEYYSKICTDFTMIALLFLTIVFTISILKPWGPRKISAKLSRKTILIIASIGFVLIGGFILANGVSLRYYRNIQISNSDLTRVKNGIFQGEANVGGFIYQVKVEIENHSIKDIKILQNRNSDYALFANGVIPRIIEKQNANVQAITGASTTSKAIMKAVEQALENASR